SAEDRRRFLRRLDHELKNPLTAILAGLANLSMSAGGGEQGATLESVRTQVQRLSRLAAELRKLSELEVRPLERAPVDTSLLLEEAFNLAQDGGATEDLALTLSIPRAPWPLPKVNGDRDLLILALHNLLSNAIKFSRPGDTVEVRAFEDGSSVVVEVADTGTGIPEDEIPHVWEELYRGEGARGVPGSGLGLALVRAIVARHDGQVNLRSRPGEGTVFTIRLPVGSSGG
ncbi:MAG: HAMP domain-containing sensor histidine kinase, partial [Anaerolineales bacterium]